MRTVRSLLLAVCGLALALPGCTGGTASASELLLGTWTIDVNAMKKTDDYQKASDAERKMMEGFLSAMELEVTFTQTEVKSKMSMFGQTQEDSMPYSIKSQNGSTLILTSPKEPEDVTVVVAPKRLTFQKGNETFELKRK